MEKLTQMIRDIVNRFNEWLDEYDRQMGEWRSDDPESYYSYMDTITERLD